MQFKLIDFGRAKQLVHLKETKITAGSPEFLGKQFDLAKLTGIKGIIAETIESLEATYCFPVSMILLNVPPGRF